jgi:hypothetical protein
MPSLLNLNIRGKMKLVLIVSMPQISHGIYLCYKLLISQQFKCNWASCYHLLNLATLGLAIVITSSNWNCAPVCSCKNCLLMACSLIPSFVEIKIQRLSGVELNDYRHLVLSNTSECAKYIANFSLLSLYIQKR